MLIALAALMLAACTPAQTDTTNVQNTALAIAQTGVALTQTVMPTATLTNTPTALPTSTPPATPIPTQPIVPLLTPDAIQVERWKEYQTELARSIFPHDPPEWFLCEWDILGRSGQEVYVWAVCGVGERSGSVPVVIYLNADGSIQNAEKPKNWSVENIYKMFPEDVRNKFYFMEAGEVQKMSEHLEWRRTNPEVPPLVILSAMPAPTFLPATATFTPSVAPVLTPDAIQVERWQEYQTELAKSLLPKDTPEHVLCEWVILGQSEQEVYVMAVCLGSGRATAPAVIRLGADGSIQNVEAVGYGSTRTSNIQRLFPTEVQEMIYSEPMQVTYGQLVEHLDWRFSHREEPPLVVLSATAMP